jgi:LmbE family N-acetylglucosaminyl deacetylase
VLVTNGNRHGLMNRRYLEFRNATATLGVSAQDLLFLGFPDGRLREEDPGLLQRRFETIIRDYDPQIVLYPHPQDVHPDHAVSGQIVESILKADFPNTVAYQFLVHHHRFPQPKRLEEGRFLLPPVTMTSFDKEWQRFMLPTSIEEQKLHAVLDYGSQLRVPFLRSLLLSLVRKNELFAIQGGSSA